MFYSILYMQCVDSIKWKFGSCKFLGAQQSHSLSFISETQQSRELKMGRSATPEVDLPQKVLQIKQDDRFFSRLMSKENSMANPSFRVYHGGVSVAVPFVWESQPGTPKHTFCEKIPPPLTPPPSYYTNYSKKTHQETHEIQSFTFAVPKEQSLENQCVLFISESVKKSIFCIVVIIELIEHSSFLEHSEKVP
ncbi:hypothetical protein OIU77_020499 [Salix suchowensis]|uniref:Uncharacterized protein n=1 Tax=Salix suchowensis TaxID=1278906 RepID=A0ABQ9CAP0_9ROSI|nr:hypothetical protein OIU77_020499 [Salix suchowensis]